MDTSYATSSSSSLLMPPASPSQDLTLTLAGMKLDDGPGREEEQDDQTLSTILEGIATNLDLVREEFFTIQEKRHARVSHLADETIAAPMPKEEGAEKSAALDMAMTRLYALLEAVSEEMRVAEGRLKTLSADEHDEMGMLEGDAYHKSRPNSAASLRSLDSFDHAFNEINAAEEKPALLKTRYEELVVQWEGVQSEARKLEEELSGDKYLLVFTSICDQMEGMMESLEKALASCEVFVRASYKDRSDGELTINGSYSSHTVSRWSSAEDRQNELKQVKRSFNVKRGSYGPACEQMFASLEKGVQERSTKNGTISRNFLELRERWKNLRERVSKMDKELRHIEEELMTSEERGALHTSRGSPREHTLTPPSRNSATPRSHLRDKNDSTTTTPTNMNRSVSIGEMHRNTTKALSPSNTNSGLFLSPSSEASTSPRLNKITKTTYSKGQHPPSTFYNNDRGNRLSMQTPEPTIAARVQRMRLFAPKSLIPSSSATPSASKRSSRPPPAKYNASVFNGSGSVKGGASYAGSSSAASAASTSPVSSRLLALPSSTQHALNVKKRSSVAWSANGRSIPLSAAALAQVPNAMPGVDQQQRRVSNGSTSNSVANFRLQRAAANGGSEYGYNNGRSYTPSVMSGRNTPTFSDAGGSDYTWSGMGEGSRRRAVYSTYRANPNDALDVEVAAIAQSLGVGIERVDPPLPRGVRDMTPNSSKTVRYEVGGKTIVCKMLQLHRPASVRSNDDKTNKILTRVGGGWIDLRQYLLSRMCSL
ncbi:hypothetical protein CBS101457_005339 [Exobasidium rhododendri]|nr:hypothetical protein CBS101457_005339 [Exobasidium rhododendri]